MRHMPPKRNIRPSLGLMVVISLLIAACSKPEVPPEAIRPLQVLKVVAGGTASDAVRTYSGEVRSRYDTALAFRVGGKIAARLVNVGDHVAAGQVLARLDPEDVRLAAQQAAAQRTLAWQELTRYRDLHKRKFVSQAALDAREASFKAADAQSELTKNQTEYATLKADKAGVVGQVLADPGQVVSAGQPVLRTAPDGDREIALSVPENELNRFKPGLEVEVSLYAMPGKDLIGKIREISPVADPVTRTYPLRVSLPGQMQIPLGLSATIKLKVANGALDNALQIPLTALFQKEGSAAVWIVADDDTVSLRPVSVLQYHDDAVIISAGLTSGERIAAAGVHRLAAGQKVRPVEVGAGGARLKP